VEKIIAVMRQTARSPRRSLRALIVVRWRSRLRVQEALSLGERDLDARRGSLLVAEQARLVCDQTGGSRVGLCPARARARSSARG
jgi:hypothetical protein